MLCLEIGHLEAQRACDGKPGTSGPTEVFSTVVPFDTVHSWLTPETIPAPAETQMPDRNLYSTLPSIV